VIGLVLGADVVADDGPMTICGMVVGGIITVDWTVTVGVPVDVGVLVLIVRDGMPVTDAQLMSNPSMMLCREETTLTEGSSKMEQLTQVCMPSALAVVQRQSAVVQLVTVDPMELQIEAH